MMTNNANSKAVRFSVTIEIGANVDAASHKEAVEFMLERLEGMTISSTEGIEKHDWDCTLSNIKLENELKTLVFAQ